MQQTYRSIRSAYRLFNSELFYLVIIQREQDVQMPECNTMIPLQIQTSEQKPVRMMCKNQLPTSNPDHNLCLCLSVNPISSTKTGNGRSDQAFIPGWADPYLCVAWGCWTVDLECCCQIPLSRLFAADPSGRVQRWGKSQEVVLKVVCSEAALSCRLRQPIHSEARPCMGASPHT